MRIYQGFFILPDMPSEIHKVTPTITLLYRLDPGGLGETIAQEFEHHFSKNIISLDHPGSLESMVDPATLTDETRLLPGIHILVEPHPPDHRRGIALQIFPPDIPRCPQLVYFDEGKSANDSTEREDLTSAHAIGRYKKTKSGDAFIPEAVIMRRERPEE